MKNLSVFNILVDYGKISITVVRDFENLHSLILPTQYVDFIIHHNGASLIADIFDYDDPNIISCKNRNSIAFNAVEEIQQHIDNLKYDEEQDWDVKYLFEDGLIPFGENGGGDMICFDYRKNRTTNNPPIVIWNHDMGLEHRVVFIANNFEKFINMLHEPED